MCAFLLDYELVTGEGERVDTPPPAIACPSDLGVRKQANVILKYLGSEKPEDPERRAVFACPAQGVLSQNVRLTLGATLGRRPFELA